MTTLTQFDKAIILATKAHSGDVDKAGKPYIFHPIRVASFVDKIRKYPIFENVSDEIVEKVRVACVLHDVVEDTTDKPNPVTLETLREEGFDEDVIAGVDGMTKREGETYKEAIRRAIQHIVSRMGKACDLTDNMDVDRLRDCSEDVKKAAMDRVVERYMPAFKVVLGEDPETLYELVRAFKDEVKSPIFSDRQIEDFLTVYTQNTIDLTDKQRQGVYMALKENVSLLSGAAGTGIVSTLKAIVECVTISKDNAKVHVYTATGKAKSMFAGRLSVDTIKTVKAQISSREIIDGDLVVIDEPQMISPGDLHHLLKRVHHANILLVGDLHHMSYPDGIKLQELIQETGIPTTNLTELFRSR